MLLLISSLFIPKVLSYTYFANTGDAVHVHCPIPQTSVCGTYDSFYGQQLDPIFNIVWVYSEQPPDVDLSSGKDHHFHSESTTAQPPWVPDIALNNPQPIKNGGRYYIYSPKTTVDKVEVVLQIKNVRFSDAGTYACYCSDDFPPSAVGIHQVTVIGKPYTIVTAYEEGGYHFNLPSTKVISEASESSNNNITVRNLSNVTMVCVYSDTLFPVRKYVWLKDGHDFASRSGNTLTLVGMT